VILDDDDRVYVRRRLTSKLGKFATHIERLTARFADVNGPRGGIDTTCAIKVVISGLDSVVYKARASDPRTALDEAATGAARAVRRTLGRQEPRGSRSGAVPVSTRRRTALGAHDTSPAASPPRSATARRTRKRRPSAPPEGGSLIGRRVGRAAENLELALARPEKLRGDAVVDTAASGRSATDRRAGGGSTARRNTRGRAPSATVMLEDSAQDRPSRKSTRKSANRAKADNNLRLRAVSKARAPSTRARKAASRR